MALSATTDNLLATLRRMCAIASNPGRRDDLILAAELIARLLRRFGAQVIIDRMGAAPLIIAQLSGRSEANLLLYHHYDCAPPGPWRDWSHEPFSIAERDGMLFGRGVADGKGPLVAHLATLEHLLQQGTLPCRVTLVIDGESLQGSPNLAERVLPYRELLTAQLCLGSAGERDLSGRPFCYRGSRGLQRVRLRAAGAQIPLAPGYAASLANPLWRLIWALAAIKGADEDVKLNGFYDVIQPPGRTEGAAIRQAQIDEQGRLSAWGSSQFLFNMRGVPLVRAESTVPTCHVISLTTIPDADLGLGALPSSATAEIEFQLVPDQRPVDLVANLRSFVEEQGFSDLQVEPIDGAYPPIYQNDSPAFQALLRAAQTCYGEPVATLPLGAFTIPLAPLCEAAQAVPAVVAVADFQAASHGPDERIALDALIAHGHLLEVLLDQLA